jgi:homospermidine synthase
MKYCTDVGAMYIDTCVEPWEGGYTQRDLTVDQRSNYFLRECMNTVVDYQKKVGKKSTLLTCHGANPGLVSHLLKRALLDLARDTGVPLTEIPKSAQQWAKLSKDLGVKLIQIAERDTQISSIPKRRGEFCNTWSIDGFISEGQQPAELGWGTHEKSLPEEGREHSYGCKAAIYLQKPGMSIKVRSWTPMEGHYHGFLITHNESISIADYFTLRDDNSNIVYRPTCHYAYHPSDATVLSVHELNGKNGDKKNIKYRLLTTNDIVEGIDELGVLICGHKKNAYWYGSQLSIEETRKLAPYNTATTLQVAITVVAGVIYAIQNPNLGFLHVEDIDFEKVLEITTPYLGNVVGVYTDWNPLLERDSLFPEPNIDWDDPWQFKNIIV